MRPFLHVYFILGFAYFGLCACTHFAANPSSPNTLDNNASVSFTQVCVEARSDERRQELQAISKLALAYLDHSEWFPIPAKENLLFINAAICNEETLTHTLIISLPNIRSIDEAFERKTKFRRPHLTKIDTQCVANYGPLFFAERDRQRNNTKLFFSPFINWRSDSLKGIAKTIRSDEPITAYAEAAKIFQLKKQRAPGDESLDAYCSAVLSERHASKGKVSASAYLGAYTPSIELYPIALKGLLESLGTHTVLKPSEVSTYNLPVNYFLAADAVNNRKEAACAKPTLLSSDANPCH